MVERLIISGIIIAFFVLLWLALRAIQIHRANQALAVMPSETANPVLLYFKSDNCAPCVTQEQYLTDLEESVGQRMSVRRINTDYDREIAANYGVITVPTTLIVDPAGVVKYINYGITTTSRLAHQLEKVQ